MNIRIELLRCDVDITGMLISDGWVVEGNLACHPDAQDEKAVRIRLAGVGLLTSSALRIEFDRTRLTAQLSRRTISHAG
jgi:hypothetical protein